MSRADPRQPLPISAASKDRFVIGDMAHVRDELMRYRDELKVEEFRFRMQWPGIGQEEMLDAIRRLGKVAETL